ncbi:GDSL-type esterase/lipase family protein [Nocardia sp. NPDC127526]|uniref:GDSL-type esterase/lipase family protein n=1 Tax=Nocardia sp. NPDC127526 TaxID=3345393 RepID=UPI00363C2B55
MQIPRRKALHKRFLCEASHSIFATKLAQALNATLGAAGRARVICSAWATSADDARATLRLLTGESLPLGPAQKPVAMVAALPSSIATPSSIPPSLPPSESVEPYDVCGGRPLIIRNRIESSMRATFALLSVIALGSAPLTMAHAERPGDPMVVVALGDSFISGEGGRWAGNSNEPFAERSGTDRAWTGTGYDVFRIYGTTYGGCHRSDSAEVFSAFGHTDLDAAHRESTTRDGVKSINLACSGAESRHIVDTAFKGEPPQSAQLATLAETNRIGVVVLSIGGNDLELSSILRACAMDWGTTSPCGAGQHDVVMQRIPAMRHTIVAAIDSIRGAMRGAGHPDSSYRLIIQSYPSPVPGSFRDPGDGYVTALINGTPFYMSDMKWLHDVVTPAISQEIRAIALDQGAEFLDLSHALEGREVRNPKTVQGAAIADAEWVRFLSSTAQGDLQESFHPNYYGQQRLGKCLEDAIEHPASEYVCSNDAAAG